jgi:hypothetical protein
MPYQPAIPQPGTLLSQSQVDILNNFQELNNVYLGVNNYISLPRQAVAPAAAANQISMYTQDVGGVTSLFILPETGAGAAVNITTALKAANGWCRLPCGIQLVWGSVPVNGHNNATFTFPRAFTGAAYMVQATGQYSGGMNQAFYTATPTNTNVVIYNTNVNNMTAYVFAIGETLP